MFNPLDYLEHAPCWWAVVDDGEPYPCKDCGGRFHASEMVYALTPNGTTACACKECMDPDWMAKAKKMPGKI